MRITGKIKYHTHSNINIYTYAHVQCMYACGFLHSLLITLLHTRRVFSTNGEYLHGRNQNNKVLEHNKNGLILLKLMFKHQFFRKHYSSVCASFRQKHPATKKKKAAECNNCMVKGLQFHTNHLL